MKFNFEIFGHQFGVMVMTRKTLKQPVAGVTNRTHDGYYVPFLDYDGIPLDWLEGELESMQEQYALGDLYVFESSARHYHVVGFDKMTRSEYQDLLARSSCDRQYHRVPFTWGARVATLRVTEKHGRGIVFKKVVETMDTTLSRTPANYRREKSLAHKKFFEGQYAIEAPTGRYDNYADVIIAKYQI